MNYSQKLLREYWTEWLGAPIEQPSGTITVCEHGTLSGYSGIMAFKRNNACILSAPPAVVEDVRQITFGKSCNDIWSHSFFENALKEKLDRIVPGWLGEIARDSFKPCHTENAREISPSEWKLFETFLSECSPEEVDVSSLETAHEPTVGVFVDGKIVSASGYECLMDKVAHIGILTHPNSRHRGYAKQAISAITDIALGKPIGVQYWTLQSNFSSVSAAKSLGFRPFAETMGIRLK